MKYKITNEYEITYSVEYFLNTEGGMDTEGWTDGLESLQEAVHSLEMAEASRPNFDWIITVQVKTKRTGQ